MSEARALRVPAGGAADYLEGGRGSPKGVGGGGERSEGEPPCERSEHGFVEKCGASEVVLVSKSLTLLYQ